MDQDSTRDATRSLTVPVSRGSTILTDPSIVGDTVQTPAPLSVLRFRQSVDDLTLPSSPHHTIMVNVGKPYRLEERMDGRVYRTLGVRGDVAIVPAGMDVALRTREREPQRVEGIAVLLDPDFVNEIARGADVDAGRIAMIGTLGARDAVIEQTALTLAAELEAERFRSDLYVESLATTLAIHLLRNHSSLAAPTTRTPGLSPAALRRVTSFIEENLDQNVSLAEIASVSGMSPFHFSRMFKHSTGYSPHQYILRRRVDRARILLATTDLPLHEVAARSGFADQSHLTRQMRRLLGTTPRSFRQASRRDAAR